jgi:hypothetical protein
MRGQSQSGNGLFHRANPALWGAAAILCFLLAPGTSARPGIASLHAGMTENPANQIELTLQTAASGLTLGGSGTSVASMDFGSVSALGDVGAGIQRTVNGSSFTLSSPFAVRVTLVSGSSSSYTLAGSLAFADGVRIWKVDSTSLTLTSQPIATGQPYDVLVNHTLFLVVPFSAASGAVSNTVDLVVTAE